jgi:hypothetical protein
MTKEEQAIVYFKDMRKRMCEDHLKICPKDSVAYRATLIEKGFYDAAIKALEQELALEKTIAEITELRDSYEKDNYHDEADALTTALEIFDKYKAESEGENDET